MASNSLSINATLLLNLIASLDPRGVHEVILINGLNDADCPELGSDIEYHGEMNDLLAVELVERSLDGRISIRESSSIASLSSEEKKKITEFAIALLSIFFPNTWDDDVGHQFSSWKRSEMCLAHVDFLVKQEREHKLLLGNSTLFAKLVLGYCWYLYEKECYAKAMDLILIALQHFSNQASKAYASAIDLLGLLHLDTASPTEALNNFEKALNIREKLNELKEAESYQQKAIKIRLDTESKRIGNSYSNMSSILMRMGKPDEAQDMLLLCPALNDFTIETFLQKGNPRFSGDWKLLSRIRMAQGHLDEAIQLSLAALDFCRTFLPNGFKICDSYYQVADLHYQGGYPFSAKDYLQKSLCIAKSLSKGEGYLARAHNKLSEVYESLNDIQCSKKHRKTALNLFYELRPKADKSPTSESFEMLVPYMLW